MNDKNKMSRNYKDYKYEYTGYKDFLKDHRLNKEDIEKDVMKSDEYIDHDHNYEFDFDNPDEHEHNYSFDFSNDHEYEFDFNNPNEHQHDYSFEFDKNKKYIPREKSESSRDYSVRDDNKYYQQPKNDYGNKIPSNNNIISNINKFDYSKSVNKFRTIVISIVAISIIISVIGLFIDLASYDNYDDSEYEDYYSYNEPVETYCNAVAENTPEEVLDYVYFVSDYNYWYQNIADDRTTTRVKPEIELEKETEPKPECNDGTYDIMYYYEIEELEKEILDNYRKTVYIESAYEVRIFSNDDVEINLIIINVDDEWYLYKHNVVNKKDV